MGDRRYLVALVFFALFVLILALLGIVFDKSITGHQISNVGWGVSNTMTLRNDDSVALTNHPVQFGRAFVSGEISAGNKPQVLLDGVAVTTQVDTKNFYSDGSLRFAVISLVIPSINAGQTRTISFQSISNAVYSSSVGTTPLSTTDMLSNYNFDATIELINPAQTHTLSARAILQNGNIHQYWTSGPLTTTVVLADHSVTRQYDVGWEQQNTKLTRCSSFSNTGCSNSNILEVADASWVNVNDVLNLLDEFVLVQSVNTIGQDTITVQRDYVGGIYTNGLPHETTIAQDDYVTSVIWQQTTQANHKSFRPEFIAEFWPAPVNKVRVRFVGENSNTEALQDLYYDLNLKTGLSSPVNVFSDTSVTHHAGARWTKQFWLTPVSEKLSINHNKEYLAQTGFADYYDSGVQSSSTIVSNWYNCYETGTSCGSLSLSNGGNGLFQRSIHVYTSEGPGGGRWELGAIPQTNALWLNNMDWRMQHVALAMGDLAGSWPKHYREGDSNKVYNRDPNTGVVPAIGSLNAVPAIGKPISVSSRPTLALSSPFWAYTTASDKLGIVSRITLGEANNVLWFDGSRQTWSNSMGHLYNFEPILYLLTGDYYRLEQLEFWTSYSTLGDSNPRGPVVGSGGGPGGAKTSPWGSRYQFRAGYGLFYMAAFAKDGTPEKEHYTNIALDSLIAWMGAQNILLSQEPSIPQTVAHTWNIGMWNFGRNQWTNPGNVFGNPDLPSPLKFPIYGSTCGSYPVITGTNQPDFCEASWMIATAAETLNFAERLGYPAGSLMDHVSGFYDWHFTTPGFNPLYLGAYRHPTTDANGVALTTPQQVESYFDPVYQSNPCLQPGLPSFCAIGNGENYLSYHTGASARLYGHDQNAYNWLRATSGVVNAYSSGVYTADPRYAVAPTPNAISCTSGVPSTCSTGLQGICSVGQHVCNLAGNGYGPCVANVAPGSQTEICDVLSQDEDCDGQINNGCSCTTFFLGSVCSGTQVCFAGSYIPQASPSNCCGPGGTCQNIIIPPGLVAAYAFSEGSGLATSDASGNGNNGVLINGPVWTTGKYDNGLLFDGVNDYVEIPSSASLNPAQITVTAWVYNPVVGAGIILSKGTAGDQYHLRLTNSNIRLVVNGGTQIELPYTISPGWHHIAATYSGTSFNLYYDGALLGSSSVTATMSTSILPLRIGIRKDANGLFINPFNGEIDEVRIYNRVLSISEVNADMLSPLVTGSTPSSPSGLIAGLG